MTLHNLKLTALSLFLWCPFMLGSCGSPSEPGDAGFVLRDRIVFRSDRHDINFDLYSMALDGSSVRRLTNDSDDEHCPSVSPDGRWIAFYEGPYLMLMRWDGAGKSRLATTGGNAEGNCPKWSFDSETIAIESVSTRLDFYYSITVIRRDGTTIGTFDTNATAFDFSPTGTQLVLGEYNSSGLAEDQKITIVSLDGSARRVVVAGRDPIWSSADLIAYRCDVEGTSYPTLVNLCVIKPDGTGQRRVQVEFPYLLSFSPDGSKLAFGCDNNALCVVTVDGTQVFKASIPGSGRPSWIPDGSGLIMGCGRTDPSTGPRSQAEICRIGFGSSEVEYLTHSAADDNTPSLAQGGS